MAEAESRDEGAPGDALRDMVARADAGARSARGIAGWIAAGIALVWSLFQLWYASPLPFTLDVLILNDTQARSIHLALALFLAFCAYPAFKSSPLDRIPWHDWVFAVAGAATAGYLFLFHQDLAARAGAPTGTDLVFGAVGMVLLLEATRRALGPALTIVALVFLGYTFGGQHMPDVIAHKGASLSKTLSHQWLSTEGVFGIALGVSTSFVFLFVLFGALLEKAGAGNYFIKVAFALLGHLRGGPAKAAVLSSAMTGLISGSSIANVVTTGTFTIPLMKRVGFTPEKAGAVEVASSVNGQIMPPVMGAAAFLMVEYVGVSYVDVIKAAFLPALISYIALLYIVHLEALRAGLEGIARTRRPRLRTTLIATGATIAGLIVLSGVVYYGLGWVKVVSGPWSGWVIGTGLVAVYLLLLRHAAALPDLAVDDPDAPVVSLPEFAPTVQTGLHFLLPVVVLVWCLMVERLSPGLSAFWATALMIAILVTQRPLTAWFRGQRMGLATRIGLVELFDGLVTGARNMIGIGVATAAAGIIVGTVTLTGIGLVMTEFVEFVSGGNLAIMLIFTALISLVLGMGLPTTANYIVVATLMAPVIVTLAGQNGLVVPLIAVHLFVFYFGIMADVTPPVGLASFAAAAVSGGDPIRTGVTAFFYSLRTVVLPFIFIFNTEILMIGIEGWWEFVLTVLSAILAMLVFAAALQGWFITRSRLWESAALLLVAFTLLRPGYWMDQIIEPYETAAPARIVDIAARQPANARLTIRASGVTLEGEDATRTVAVPLGAKGPGSKRLADAGLDLKIAGDKVTIETVTFGSPAQKLGLDLGWTVEAVIVPADQPDKQWMFVPALVLLGGIVLLQRRRALVARQKAPA